MTESKSSIDFLILQDRASNEYILNEDHLKPLEFYFPIPLVREFIEEMNKHLKANKRKEFSLLLCLKYSMFILIGATFWALLAIDIFSLKKQHNHDGETTTQHIVKLMALDLIILLAFNVIAPILLVWMNCQEINLARDEARKEGFERILAEWNQKLFNEQGFYAKGRDRDRTIILTSNKITSIGTDFSCHVGQELSTPELNFTKEKVNTTIIPPYAIPTGRSENDSLIIIERGLI